LFTSEDSANLLQYRLFDVAPPPQIIQKARLCSRLLAKKEELQQLWRQNVMIKTTISLLLIEIKPIRPPKTPLFHNQ
jgi:hypothetical protein